MEIGEYRRKTILIFETDELKKFYQTRTIPDKSFLKIKEFFDQRRIKYSEQDDIANEKIAKDLYTEKEIELQKVTKELEKCQKNQLKTKSKKK